MVVRQRRREQHVGTQLHKTLVKLLGHKIKPVEKHVDLVVSLTQRVCLIGTSGAQMYNTSGKCRVWSKGGPYAYTHIYIHTHTDINKNTHTHTHI